MLERELEVAAQAARQAGKILLSLYDTQYVVELKSGSDPVTEADRRANTFIVDRLSSEFPTDGIVAEETADLGDALSKARRWYVDPLDGTKEFIAKNGEFSVMIGLTIDGEAKLGVVYQPVTEKLYSGVIGEGAFLEQAGAKSVLRVTDEAVAENLRLVVSRSHRSKVTDEIAKRLGISRETSSGSVGLKVGLIAEQLADVYVHPSDKSSAWDACAPEAILRAAGGRFTQMTGAGYRYESSDMQNRGGILACNAAAFETVVAVTKQHWPPK